MAEDTIRAYFESRLVLLEPVFPLACHRLCEGPDFSLEFGFKSQPQPEGKTHNYSIARSFISQSLRVGGFCWVAELNPSRFSTRGLDPCEPFFFLPLHLLPSKNICLPLFLPPSPGSGILLFIFHANFLNEISARLCGPCSVHAVVLNDKFQLPIFLVGSSQKTRTTFNFLTVHRKPCMCVSQHHSLFKLSHVCFVFTCAG